jgi:flagellar assembly protein FliH
MQLQSDNVAGVAANGQGGRPVARVFEDEGKGVARLEFEAVEDADPSDGRSCARMDKIARLKQEVLTLEAEIQRQADALPAKLDEARRLARLLARREWEQELEQRMAEDRAMVLKACEEFQRERARYFAAVEAQVVKLALAIAARVLHREAKMDPLLLSGAVRVALEKVEEESETRLRVPANEVAMWSAEFGAEFGSGKDGAAGDGKVRVVGDEGMARGECVLETSVGTVELGIEAQLGEIERGFFDLMQRRPA